MKNSLSRWIEQGFVALTCSPISHDFFVWERLLSLNAIRAEKQHKNETNPG